MNHVVVDTNVVSFLLKKDTKAECYRRHLEGKVLGISFMTLAEVYYGAIKSNWGRKKRERLQTALRKYSVIPFDSTVCAFWARIRAEREKVGHPITHSDAWIAASALRCDAPLVTHNPKHFEGIEGLRVISE
jgi:predicted nucleic acid-binding protein